MTLNFKKKEQIIYKIRQIASQALSAVIASFEGVSVNEITELRREARRSNVNVYVVRNTLLRRIIQETAFLCLAKILTGTNIIAFSISKPSDAARIFVKFTKENEHFKIKGGSFEGNLITTSQVELLSCLPNREEAMINLVSIVKMNSMGNLIRMLHVLSDIKIK